MLTNEERDDLIQDINNNLMDMNSPMACVDIRVPQKGDIIIPRMMIGDDNNLMNIPDLREFMKGAGTQEFVPLNEKNHSAAFPYRRLRPIFEAMYGGKSCIAKKPQYVVVEKPPNTIYCVAGAFYTDVAKLPLGVDITEVFVYNMVSVRQMKMVTRVVSSKKV